ncbi:hypothetical protein ElyMa_004939900 [Elysia marginata]|uniref:G-protein coupled receptors family 1 profile domain-containing protein n=1 Tax=Elysia marginata TaxID=1093978 RepID=A0AAV4J0D5_9GAST|nr:hypothetical protein ElyMa_004939900 [Elysia marginata]
MPGRTPDQNSKSGPKRCQQFNRETGSVIDDARQTLNKWRKDAQAVETPSYDKMTLALTDIGEGKSATLVVSEDLSKNDKETLNLTRCLSPSKERTSNWPRKEIASRCDLVVENQHNGAISFEDEKKHSRSCQDKIEKQTFLCPYLSFSAPNLFRQRTPGNETDNDCRDCSETHALLTARTHDVASRRARGVSFPSSKIETNSGKLKSGTGRSAMMEKRQGFPNTDDLTNVPRILLFQRKEHLQPRGPFKAGEINEAPNLKTDCPQSQNFKVLFNRSAMKCISREVLLPNSSTPSLTQTAQVPVREVSLEMSFSQPETSTSSGSQRSVGRRQGKMRSAFRRPGSLQIKRRQDFRSRRKSESQKSSGSFTISSALTKIGLRPKLADRALCESFRSPDCSTRGISNEKDIELGRSSGCPSPPTLNYIPSSPEVLHYRGKNRSKPLGIKNLDMIRTLFVVFVCMAVFMSPYMVTTIADVNDTWPALVHCACSYLAVVNNAINWMLYGMLNSSFRVGYRHCMYSLFLKCGSRLQTKV